MFCVRCDLRQAAEDFCFAFWYQTVFLENLNDPDSELVLSSSASANVVGKCLFKFPTVYLAVGSRVQRLLFLWLDTFTHCRSGDKFCTYS